MYNAERFIRQTLISVLASKFTDYEVLVIDDCSTDNSVAEVEKILPHFDGRLKILSTETNSGGAGVPRNIGIKNSSGKYVCFLDADDFLLPTALGEFFDLAEKFHADVVHTEKCLIFNDVGKVNFKWEELAVQSDEPHNEFVAVPFMESKNLAERIRRYLRKKFYWFPWGKFFRREFLIENKIYFLQTRYAEDMVFCFKCMCLAEKYLRVPAVTNIHRMIGNSLSTKSCTIKTWLDVAGQVVADVDEFTSGLKFFRENPSVRRDVLKFFMDEQFSFIHFGGFKAYEIERNFFDELQNPEIKPTGKNLVAAHLFAERFLT